MGTTTIRRTGNRAELDLMAVVLASLALRTNYGPATLPGLDDGTTDGKIKTTASADFNIGVGTYTKAGTDDLWDLSAETDTAAGTFRAYWLLLNSSGTASIAAGTDQASAADALAALPALDGTKAVLGVYVAGAATDFNGAAGLVAQGDLYDGIPEGAGLGGDLHGTYTAELPLFVYA